ncbi:peptide chain release factor N(5)-glutamine methyltransferase [Paludibaculum fermentans]|uniref:Release factor glutamine methyltransferase n=1 Tax=Paludibaculum fermentans TaxID=1473598 RepID=A0A7S7SL83_PALFE|nr:peptide chain release factor N(5)-glutamine methyltransferase [Paludibaculum fermentans]QOY87805.1 peptide chain release factor N(5)-glutamine methyltransferase [Paludibaculum fermentans]
MTAKTAVQQGSDLLAGAGISEPRLTAEVLLLHALHKERIYLFSHPEHELSTVEWIHYGRYLHERMQGKPTQYITRLQEFYGRPFRVSPAVLVPRPETEHTVEQALQVAPRAKTLLDIGTGSGALVVTLALELKARAVATDLSFDALQVARGNAAELAARVDFVQCDLAAGIQTRFDLIVSNPPYIPDAEIPGLQTEVRDFEPHLALAGGALGTEIYHRIVPQAERLLKPGGWLIFEIGYQGEAGVREAFAKGPWQDITLIHDLAGLPRVLRGRYTP